MQSGIGFILAWVLIMLIVIHIDIATLDKHIQFYFDNYVVNGERK